MKRILYVLSIAVCVSLFSASLLFAELKVGIFDVQKVMRESKTVASYRAQFEKEINAKKKLFDDKQEKTKRMDEKLKREGATMPPAARKALEDDIANELRDLKRLKEDIDYDLQKMDRELTLKATKEISDVIEKIYKVENYSIIFERNNAGIQKYSDSLDITDKIIKIYDKR